MSLDHSPNNPMMVKGKEGEFAVQRFLPKLFDRLGIKNTTIWDVSEERQYQKVDVDFVVSTPRHELNIEVKADHHVNRSANFPFEYKRVNYDRPGAARESVGWSIFSRADVFILAGISNERITRLYWFATVDVLNAYNRQPEGCRQFVKNTDPITKTHLCLIPIKHIPYIVFANSTGSFMSLLNGKPSITPQSVGTWRQPAVKS